VIDAPAMPDFISGAVAVAVANDSEGNNGIEHVNAKALRELGFLVTVPPATSTVLTHTTVECSPGAESEAKAVQLQVKTVSGARNTTSANQGAPTPSATRSAGSSARQVAGCIV
jgi:hypothetical protein